MFLLSKHQKRIQMEKSLRREITLTVYLYGMGFFLISLAIYYLMIKTINYFKSDKANSTNDPDVDHDDKSHVTASSHSDKVIITGQSSDSWVVSIDDISSTSTSSTILSDSSILSDLPKQSEDVHHRESIGSPSPSSSVSTPSTRKCFSGCRKGCCSDVRMWV